MEPGAAGVACDVRQRLEQHLVAWLGEWPPTEELVVTTAPGRVEPGWDGQVHSVVGVRSPEGIVLSVPPNVLAEARRVAADRGFEALRTRLGTLLGRPGDRLQAGVFRWSESPTPADVLPEVGTWLPFDDPRAPLWLRPFGGEVLIALAADGDGDGDEAQGRRAYVAGVGIKRHDRFGQEMAVGTDERFAGRGLGRRLVAQAARRVVDEGMVPTYLHDPRNIASAKVAEAAGFPDRGWQILGLWP